MRNVMEDVSKKLTCFIEQRDKAICLMDLDSEKIGLIFRLLENIDKDLGTDLYLPLLFDFNNADDYADAIVSQVYSTYEEAATAITELGGKTDNVEFPAKALSAETPAALRVRAVLSYVLNMLPEEGGHRLVISLLPGKIDDAIDYQRFIGELLQYRGHEMPWFAGMRLFIRGTEDLPFASNFYEDPFVEGCRPPVSQDDIAQKFEELANDSSSSEVQRMNAMFQSAIVESGRGNSEVALNKFSKVVDYYEKADQPVMHAAALISVGDNYLKDGARELATESYQKAIEPALKSKNEVLLFTISHNLGRMAFEDQDFETARDYFHTASSVARGTGNIQSVTNAYQCRAHCEVALLEYDAAAESYFEALDILVSLKVVGLAEELLTGLDEILPQTQDPQAMLRRRFKIQKALTVGGTATTEEPKLGQSRKSQPPADPSELRQTASG
jgi:tetratricopeptide (TPR) repeat protein